MKSVNGQFETYSNLIIKFITADLLTLTELVEHRATVREVVGSKHIAGPTLNDFK